MVVNFTMAEYHILCKVADFHGTTPAQWAHSHIMHEALRQYRDLKALDGEGRTPDGGIQCPSIPSPIPTDPSQDVTSTPEG